MIEHRSDLYLLGPVTARLTVRNAPLDITAAFSHETQTYERLEGTTPVGCRMDLVPNQSGYYLHVRIDALPDGREGHWIEAVADDGTRVASWQLDAMLAFFDGGYHLAYRNLYGDEAACPGFMCEDETGGACPDHAEDLS